MRKLAITHAWRSFLSKFVKNTQKTDKLDNSFQIAITNRALNTPLSSLSGVENEDKQQKGAKSIRESVLSGKTHTSQKVQKDAKNKLSPELGDNCTPLKQPKNEERQGKEHINKRPTYCKTTGCIKFANKESLYCEEHTDKIELNKRLTVHKLKKENKSQYTARRRKELLEYGLKSGYMFGKPIIEVMYLRYKKGADRRGLEFNLTLEQFSEYWQNDCSYCATPIRTIGLDRVDNSVGYVAGNIVPCCTECNKMKRAMNVEDFISHCIRIAEKARQ